MKKLIWVLGAMLLMVACQDNDQVKNEFTGNQAVYPLMAGSQYAIDGTVMFQEKVDGSAFITVLISGTEGKLEHPVHLHLGDISEPGADVYALLNPVLGSTGRSETTITQASDESPISYQQLIALNACMKIHLAASGPDRDVILAGGNVGASAADDTSTGRLGIGVCKSE